MRVGNIMSTETVACSINEPLRNALEAMVRRSRSCIPVVSGEDGTHAAVLGALHMRDVAAAALRAGSRLDRLPVWQVMRTEVATCRPDTDLRTVKAIMIKAGTCHVAVVDASQRLLGTLSVGELARVAVERGSDSGLSGEDVADVLAARSG